MELSAIDPELGGGDDGSLGYSGKINIGAVLTGFILWVLLPAEGIEDDVSEAKRP